MIFFRNILIYQRLKSGIYGEMKFFKRVFATYRTVELMSLFLEVNIRVPLTGPVSLVTTKSMLFLYLYVL